MPEEAFLQTVLLIHSSKVVIAEPKSVEGEHFLADALILLALKFGDGKQVSFISQTIHSYIFIIKRIFLVEALI